MTSRLLLDNWTLFDAERLVQRGFSAETASELHTDISSGHSEWCGVSANVIRVQALLRLLVDIVTREHLVVERKFLATWGNEDSPFRQLLTDRIVVPEHVSGDRTDARALTKAIVQELCVTLELQAQQRDNEQSWDDLNEVTHSDHSVILWGGAGYLRRSALL